jgi:hypothetical protein
MVLRSTSSEHDAWDGSRDREGVHWGPDPGARAPTLLLLAPKQST